MWNDSHPDETWIDCLKRYLRIWKKTSGWSDATVFDEIVKAHQAIGAPEKTGIKFQPGSEDEYNRKKANAARITRMLNDQLDGDDDALLNINFLPSFIAGMPAELQIRFLNEYLAPVGLCVSKIQAAAPAAVSVADVTSMMKEGGESVAACAQLLKQANEETLVTARKETSEAMQSYARTLEVIDSMIASKGQLRPVSSGTSNSN